MKIRFLFFLFIIPLILSSCSRESAPSGKMKRRYGGDPASGFNSKPRKSRKPPQMGFYEKRTRTNIFVSAKNAIALTFANRDKKHKLKNDQRSSSQSYANTKQKEQNDRMKSSFVKGKIRKNKRKNKSSDNNSDSFSSGPRKRKKK